MVSLVLLSSTLSPATLTHARLHQWANCSASVRLQLPHTIQEVANCIGVAVGVVCCHAY